MELTGGSSLLNGMYFFRGDVPMKEFAAAQGPLVGLGLRVFGRRLFPKLPYEEGFFLPFARQFREELSMPLVLLGGINQLATIETAMGEGFEFVAMARALLREPDLVNRLAAGETARRHLHPLQQVPAHHLQRDALRAGPHLGTSRMSTTRTTVVTGSASGMGAATRELLEADGQRVIGVDLRDAEVVADLATPEGRAAAVAEVTELAGGAAARSTAWSRGRACRG